LALQKVQRTENVGSIRNAKVVLAPEERNMGVRFESATVELTTVDELTECINEAVSVPSVKSSVAFVSKKSAKITEKFIARR
jgi:hypothetical protein